MNIDERLFLFHGMISCNYKIYLWQYDKEFHPLYTNCEADELPGEMVTALGFQELLISKAESGNRYPLILSNEFGLIWIAGFEYRDLHIDRFHLIGPAFTGSNTHLLMRKKLDSYGFSPKLYGRILTLLESVPIIPSSTLMQYGVMLHYMITGEQIPVSQIRSVSEKNERNQDEISLISGEHRGVYLAEQELLQAFREGNPEYLKALDKSLSLSSGVRTNLGDPLRESKNNILVLLTLCSRASIEGGLNPSIAYSLNDYYADRIERCRTLSDTIALASELMEDFIMRVHELRNSRGLSPRIQDACDYISFHLKDALTLKQLAARAGYADYYFSKKFHDETGLSVGEYICRKKIEKACSLLTVSLLKVEEIMDETGFLSKSHFYSSFQRIVGMSPLEYRERKPDQIISE